MANSSEKMKLRAELMSVLNKYTTAIEIDNDQLKNDIEKLGINPAYTGTAKIIYSLLKNSKSGVSSEIIIESHFVLKFSECSSNSIVFILYSG